MQTNSLDIRTETVGVAIYANAEGLKSDLTGFQLVEDEKRFQREEEILTSMSRLLRAELDNLHQFFRPDTDERSAEDAEYDEDQAFRKRVKILLKGSAAGIFLTLVNPPFGVTTTVGSIATAFGSSLWEKSRRSVLSQQDTLTDRLKRELQTLYEGLEKAASVRNPSDDQHDAAPDVTVETLDPTDAGAVSGLFNSFAADPAGLARALRKQLEQNRDEPLWNLHLARVYRTGAEDNRASIYYNKYLDVHPEDKVLEELATLYEGSGKHDLADFVRFRRRKS